MSNVYLSVNLNENAKRCESVFLVSNERVVLSKKKVRESSKETLVEIVGGWRQRSRQRKQLAQLDKHLLDDLGLTEEMVKNEVAKPFWK